MSDYAGFTVQHILISLETHFQLSSSKLPLQGEGVGRLVGGVRGG